MTRFYGTREYRFEAAHREYCTAPILTVDSTNLIVQQRNLEMYGDGIHPHGHNFVLWAEISGTRHPKSEMILDLGEMDAIVEDKVIKKWDHFYHDSSSKKVQTLERITKTIWDDLRPELDLLSKITLFEDDDAYVEYWGMDSAMDITRSYKFSAAHRTANPKLSGDENKKIYGKCFNLHGHTYTLDVTVRGNLDDEYSIVVNRVKMDEALNEILDHFNYKILNGLSCFKNTNATTENLLVGLWTYITMHLVEKKVIDERNITLHKMRLRETGRNFFEYYGPGYTYTHEAVAEYNKMIKGV